MLAYKYQHFYIFSEKITTSVATGEPDKILFYLQRICREKIKGLSTLIPISLF
jgi:hypothetical protein